MTDKPLVEQRDVGSFMTELMRGYAEEATINRSIPDYRDGLKTVQRFIMWQMYRSKLFSTSKHVKLAKLSGMCMAYHPHGDGSIDSAAVNMSRIWINRTPLVDIQGNKGSIDGSGAAASRYIEARMTANAEMFFTDIDSGAVEMIDNFDNTEKVPETLPVTYPALFVNGSAGIGYGVATSILPHNPSEMIELMMLSLNGKLTYDAAGEIYKGPDFPVGGKIIGDYKQELTSTKATYHFVADIEQVGKDLVVKSTPFKLNTTKLLESIVDTITRHNIVAVRDVIDGSVGDTCEITITFKRGTSDEVIQSTKSMLEHYSAASAKISANNVCVDGDRLRAVTLLEYIQMFTKFRLHTMRRVAEHQLAQALEKLDVVEARIIAIKYIELIKDMLLQASSKEHLIELLSTSDQLKLNKSQAEIIAAMRVQSLVNDVKVMSKYENDRKSLKEKINHCETLIADDAALRKELEAQLKELKAFFDQHFPRRTSVGHKLAEKPARQTIAAKALPVEKMVLSFSRHDNSINVTKQHPRDDKLITVECMSNDVVLAFTSGGHVIQMRAGDYASGRAVRLYKNVTPDEVFMDAIVLENDLSVVTLSKRGYMKRAPIKKCVPKRITTRNSRIGHLYTGLKGGDDTVRWLRILKPDEQITGITVYVPEASRAVTKVQQVDIAGLMARSDGGGSSGARFVNTRDGAWKIEKVVCTDALQE